MDDRADLQRRLERLEAQLRDNQTRLRNVLVGDMLNLLELSDGWGHLKFGTNWDGNQHAYDATVELAKV